jgi:hypothetical protein
MVKLVISIGHNRIGLVASDGIVGSYKPGAGCQNSVEGPFMCQLD